MEAALGIFSEATAEYQKQIASKKALVASLLSGHVEPQGMSSDDAIRVLLEQISTYEEMVVHFRGRDYA